MLLEGALLASPDFLDNSPRTTDWQDYLTQQTSSHPLFRRRRLGLHAGKGRVVLTGKVDSYYEKQLAQEFVRRCDGVQHIDNRIEVAY